jgi:hypothetical protein
LNKTKKRQKVRPLRASGKETPMLALNVRVTFEQNRMLYDQIWHAQDAVGDYQLHPVALALNGHPQGVDSLENFTGCNRWTLAFHPTRAPRFPFDEGRNSLFIVRKLYGNAASFFVWQILDREYLRFCINKVPIWLEPRIEDRRRLRTLRKLGTLYTNDWYLIFVF